MTRADRTTSRWTPTRPALVDAGFLLVLSTVALLGLSTTFTGVGYLLVSLGGVVVGLLLTGLVRALRWPAIAAVTIAVPVWFGVGVLVSGEPLGTVADLVSSSRVRAKKSVTRRPAINARLMSTAPSMNADTGTTSTAA